MSIFGSIASAVFGSSHAAPAAPPVGAISASSAQAGAQAKPISQAEVEAMIAKIPGAQRPDCNWKQSIVDLMALLKLDSSLNARKQLAKELGYTGALDGSAVMNVWLHKKVMEELAQSGGTVPNDLKYHA